MKLSRMPSSIARDQRAGQAAEAAEHADREHAADIFAPDRRLDRLDDDQQRAGDAAVAIEMPKAMRLMRVGEAPMSCSASWSCATAEIARPMKV